MRAVQLARAAAAIAAAQRVWPSVDVLTPSRWAQRECERLAAERPDEWPRLLTPTEEWLLWREATREASAGYPFLDAGQLAELLQRSSERAAAYRMTLRAAAVDSETALLLAAQRGFDARCRALNAASVVTLLPRLAATGMRAQLLLRGFDTIPPWLAALVRPDAPIAAPAHTVKVRGVRTSDGEAQMEAIAR